MQTKTGTKEVDDFDGYVIYGKIEKKESPFAVVSDNFECKATTNYIPQKLKDFLVQVEDRRFYQHRGIDVRGIARAIIENIKAGKVVQGGSFITQQLARNLLNDNSKTVVRKIRESLKAIEIERTFSKDEIIELYFNNVYFGRNIRGIRAAGLYYFEKEVQELNQVELLTLLTILRGPNYYIKNPEKTSNRFKLLNSNLFNSGYISITRFKKNLKSKTILNSSPLQLINSKALPFIAESSNTEKRIIKSTINLRVQAFAKKFVFESKYPVSIIIIRDNKVIASSSSYGADYPFTAKTNVGSTLKPFLYCYLRDSGVQQSEKFDAHSNKLSWKVREANYYRKYLQLGEALFYSNNNVFINACDEIGMQGSLGFLGNILRKSDDNFFPSSILGALKCGLSLYELALTYATFFSEGNLTETRRECLTILNKIAKEKLGLNIENAFLKTGTTNDNNERIAILKDADTTYAILRNENFINDNTKEGNFMEQIKRSFKSIFQSKRNYQW